MLRFLAPLALFVLIACSPAAVRTSVVSLATTPGATPSPTATQSPTATPSLTATILPVNTDTPEAPAATVPPMPSRTPTAKPTMRPSGTATRTRTPRATSSSSSSAPSGNASPTRLTHDPADERASPTPARSRVTAALPTATATPTRTPYPSTVNVDPTLPDLRTLPPTDLVIEMTPDNRRLLRLTNMIINWGPGILEVVGRSDAVSGRTIVTQNLYRANGTFNTHPAGIFIFHVGHKHWHFENFARYEVWSLTTEGKPDELRATSNKVSYCLQDTGRSALPAAAAEAVYVDCENERQGMSNGWVDTYAFDREGQDIDITGLPDGLYVVQSIVDPANRLVELHEANNVGIVYFDLQGESVETLEPESVAARMTELNGGTPK